MATPGLSIQEETSQKPRSSGTFARVAQYTLLRAVAIFITVVVGVYLTVIVANMGGHVDEIRKADIRFNISMAAAQDDSLRSLSREEYQEYVERLITLEEQRVGLDKPFIIRSFTYLTNAITLNLGRAEYLFSDSGSSEVPRHYFGALVPDAAAVCHGPTAVVFHRGRLRPISCRAAVRKFSRQSWIIALAPTSAAPSWFYGIFLILPFAAVWRAVACTAL